jgi:3D-(3,5/4)-trihydroxycyclohexane-1,2-dione acylhydrolase (decyclizing)
MASIRLTMAEALVRFLTQQFAEIDGKEVPLFGGVFAIFGHGNVAGVGPALYRARRRLPTYRAHNEQAMALAAIAFAKARARRRMMACTTSIGPGATNMVTAAALAHVNRLPVLFLPGDIFADRRPDPVLQQVEAFGDPTVSANDCFRPVSRYWDRIVRAEQLLVSLPNAIRVMTDPAECGPATLALPQDVQTEAFNYPQDFFRRRVHCLRRNGADPRALADAVAALKSARRPLIVAGGGVKYSLAESTLAALAAERRIPVAETQAGKGSLAWDHPCNVGAIGVTGTAAANDLARRSDCVLAVGTRLGDFATGSRALLGAPDQRLIQLNVAAFDAGKHNASALVADARTALRQIDAALGRWRASPGWAARTRARRAAWFRTADAILRPGPGLATDAQVLAAVNRAASRQSSIVVCAAGGLPGELHKLWRATDSTQYHLEYGYSCMGYEIAGGLGAKLARSEREVYVLVGDGSYLMMNSEIATSVQLGAKLTIVVLDNRGFGCISRLQQATGGARFNNLFARGTPWVDFVGHARSLGADAIKVADVAGLEAALAEVRRAKVTSVIVIDTDPEVSTGAGGAWWDVAVNGAPRGARARRLLNDYGKARAKQNLGA